MTEETLFALALERSPADRAAFLADAYRLIAARWPWVELATAWILASEEPDDGSQRGFRLAGPGYAPTSSWTSLAGMPKRAAWRSGRLADMLLP